MKLDGRIFGAAALVAVFGSACGGDDTTDLVREERPLAPAPSATFAATVTQFLPDGSTSGLVTLEDPAAPAVVTLDDALELPGTAALFGSEGAGYVIVGHSDSPTLTQYDLDANGRLVPGRALSLGAFGITSAFRRPGLVPTLSPEKAYFLDDNSLQGIVWNPSAMEVVTSFSLAEAEPSPELSLELGENAVLRDELLFVPANYRTPDDGEAGRALVLVIDTRTDELVKVIEDDRCGNTLHAVLHEDGAIYLATGTLGASFYAIGFPASYPEPCLLRILPGETDLDPGFYRSLVTVAGGRPAGRLVRGKNGNFYVSALLEEELPEPLGSTDNIYAEWEASAWRLFRFRLDEAGPGAPMADMPLGGGGGRVLSADGVEYVQQVQNDLSKTTLYVPLEDGGFSRGIEVPGIPYALRRVR